MATETWESRWTLDKLAKSTERTKERRVYHEVSYREDGWRCLARDVLLRLQLDAALILYR